MHWFQSKLKVKINFKIVAEKRKKIYTEQKIQKLSKKIQKFS